MIGKGPGFWCRLLGLVLVAIGPSAQALDRLQEFPLRVPLTLEGEGPWYRLAVPMRVLLASRHADLRDLRVFNAAGETLAYALVAGRSRQQETLQTHEVRIFPLYVEATQGGTSRVEVRVRRNADGTLVEFSAQAQDHGRLPSDRLRRGWLLDCSRIQQPLQRLVLDWIDVEGFQRFEIEASDDLEHWRSWGEGRVTRLRFGDEQIEQREVRLPQQRARYLRLLWKLPKQAPELSKAQLQSAATHQRQAPIIWTDALPARRSGEHAYVWTLPLALPVERLRLPLEGDNLLLPVTLQARTDGKQRWYPLSRGLFYRVNRQGKVLLQDELDLPGRQRIKELKLNVDARGGGLGGQMPRLQFGVRSTELVFLSRGAPPFTLAVGKAGAQTAQLPLGTLMPGMEAGAIDRLPVAKPTWSGIETAAATPPPVLASPWDWRRIGLWTVLLAGVAVLALMAWSLLKSGRS